MHEALNVCRSPTSHAGGPEVLECLISLDLTNLQSRNPHADQSTHNNPPEYYHVTSCGSWRLVQDPTSVLDTSTEGTPTANETPPQADPVQQKNYFAISQPRPQPRPMPR
jgi:hypothetical protein